MKTLLLRLAAPLQSWGVSSGFETRTTEQLPSKSGVVGLLAAALGRGRDADLSDLNGLSFGVREDQAGVLLRDYHTARGKKSSYVTNRYYLADAVFLAGLSSDREEFLLELEAALRRPAYPLFLGRRSNPPAGPLVLGIREGGLTETLLAEPWQASGWYRRKWERSHPGEEPMLRIVTDAGEAGEGAAVRDLPVSFSPFRREYAFRGVTDLYFHPVSLHPTEHAPFAGLEG